MNRRLLLSCLALLACLPLASSRVAFSEPALSEAEGRVTSFSTQTQILNINSRLGPLEVVLDSGTLILLNNHSAATTDIRAGDRVNVRYRFDTRRAVRVHLFREQRRTGRVVSVSSTAIGLRVDGATINLRPDAQSRVDLEDILLNDRSVLVGREATAVFEPGTLILLSMAGKSQRVSGTLTAVDTANNTLTLSGKNPRTFTLETAATVRRNGETATLASLVTGDRVGVAFVRQGNTLRALALQANSTGAAP